MSAPARQVRARPAAKPRVRTSPLPKPPQKPVRKPAQKPASPSKGVRRREQSSAAFYVFATILLIAMVFGLAALNAVLAQGAFRVEELSNQQIALTQQNGELRREIDDLSSPARLTSTAAKDGLVFPDTDAIQVVHAGDSSGADTRSGHRQNTTAVPGSNGTTIKGGGSDTPSGLPGGPE